MKVCRLIALVVAVSLLIAACSSGGPTTPEPEERFQPLPEETRILELTNAFRAQAQTCGTQQFPAAPALVWVEAILDAAYFHSEEMAQADTENHVGASALERIRAEGYDADIAAENRKRTPQPPNPEEAFNAWVADAEACANLMNASYTVMGAGLFAQAGDQNTYWTQILSAPRGNTPQPNPTLAISPTTATVTVGGEAVAFTATLVNATSPINWTLDGAGTLSSTTGTTTSYTPPAAGDAGTATLSATAGDLTASATIAINTANAPPPTNTGFTITVRFTDNNLSAAKRQEVEQAIRRWETIITADLPDMTVNTAGNECDGEGENYFPNPFSGTVDDLHIDVATGPDDGPDGSLAFAGPCIHRQGDRQLPSYGVMFIDIDDVNDGAFIGTITHELGHVLGLGTMWEPPFNDFLDFTGKDANTLCDDLGTKPNDLVYTGALAVAAFQGLGGTGNIPVENGQGQGSDCGHWRESFFGNELMDSSANAADDPLSRMTIAALEDLGYAVDYAQAEPYAIPNCSPNCLVRQDLE